MKTLLYKFACSECSTVFYLEQVPGCVQCPNGACSCRWLPGTEDGRLSQGLAVKAEISEFSGVQDYWEFQEAARVGN